MLAATALTVGIGLALVDALGMAMFLTPSNIGADGGCGKLHGEASAHPGHRDTGTPITIAARPTAVQGPASRSCATRSEPVRDRDRRISPRDRGVPLRYPTCRGYSCTRIRGHAAGAERR